MGAILALCGTACAGQGTEEGRLIALARAAVVAEVNGVSAPREAKATPAKPVFVTIEIGGQVRGCRGDLTTRARSLEEEIVLAARAAAAHDPRYRPLSRQELKRFLVTVTVVERAEPIEDLRSLTPSEGLVLRSGGRTGVVLPWEGKDPATRLDWAYKKAGVTKSAPVSLHRLIAERFRG